MWEARPSFLAQEFPRSPYAGSLVSENPTALGSSVNRGNLPLPTTYVAKGGGGGNNDVKAVPHRPTQSRFQSPTQGEHRGNTRKKADGRRVSPCPSFWKASSRQPGCSQSVSSGGASSTTPSSGASVAGTFSLANFLRTSQSRSKMVSTIRHNADPELRDVAISPSSSSATTSAS